MKILSWNCHYGFTPEKAKVIENLNSNILIIIECRKIDMNINISGYNEYNRNWYGDHKEALDNEGILNDKKDLGIGVFWKEGISVTRLVEWDKTWRHNSDFRYLVPYEVKGDFKPFTLVTVWTKNKMDASDPLDYIQKAHAAIDHYYNNGLFNGRVVLIGDFNSNVIWDKLYKENMNHTEFVKKLNRMGIQECLPSEKEKNYFTYCYYRGKPCEVVDDYCFTSSDIANTAKLSISSSNEWTNVEPKRWNGSDHCPISVEFDIN